LQANDVIMVLSSGLDSDSGPPATSLRKWLSSAGTFHCKPLALNAVIWTNRI
jgi:hypothetical protein